VTPYYEHAGITIYHGDCREIVPMLNADVLVTDPPYGVSMGSQDHPSGKSPYASFDDTEGQVVDVVVPAVVTALGRVQRGAVLPGSRCAFFYPRPYEIGAVYFPAGFGFSRWGFCCSQPILYYGKDPKPITRKEPNSVTCAETSEKNGHPCPKPLGLMRWLVARVSKPNETVLDPFMGSGTTLLAAKDMGHRAIGIEIEERYCEIAAKRLSQEVLPFGELLRAHAAGVAAPEER
jgi:DNA modification methylase